MSSSEKLCLKWDDFKTNISSSFVHLRKDEEFSDVTLTCDGDQKIEAHKVILAASSSFFGNILKQNKHPHPLIYMRGMTGTQLSEVMDFIYHGEVNIFEEKIEEFLNIAEELQLRGLCNNEAPPKDPKITQSKFKTTNSKTFLIEQHLEKFEAITGADPNSSNYSNLRGKEASMVLVDTSVKNTTKDEELESTINSMIERLGEGRFVCNVCGNIEAKSKRNMRNHIEAKHIEGISIPCNQCGKSFRSRNSLAKHIYVDHKSA